MIVLGGAQVFYHLLSPLLSRHQQRSGHHRATIPNATHQHLALLVRLQYVAFILSLRNQDTVVAICVRMRVLTTSCMVANDFVPIYV